MLKLFFAVIIVLISVAVGLIVAFSAWDTMYPENGHILSKATVNTFTAFILLSFTVLGLGHAFGIYD